MSRRSLFQNIPQLLAGGVEYIYMTISEETAIINIIKFEIMRDNSNSAVAHIKPKIYSVIAINR